MPWHVLLKNNRTHDKQAFQARLLSCLFYWYIPLKPERIPVAAEGYPFILFAAFVTLCLAILHCVSGSLFGLITTCFVLWFFRDPERVTPQGENVLISPADGKVIIIEKTTDTRFAAEEVLKLSIFMNVFNVHVNRSPCKGEVEGITLQEGRFYAADKEKAVLHNEYCALKLRRSTGQKIALVQVAGLIARRIVCRAEKGDSLAPGERYGLIRFGSRVDLYLPSETKVDVSIGQKVRAGESILGSLPVS